MTKRIIVKSYRSNDEFDRPLEVFAQTSKLVEKDLATAFSSFWGCTSKQEEKKKDKEASLVAA